MKAKKIMKFMKRHFKTFKILPILINPKLELPFSKF